MKKKKERPLFYYIPSDYEQVFKLYFIFSSLFLKWRAHRIVEDVQWCVSFTLAVEVGVNTDTQCVCVCVCVCVSV